MHKKERTAARHEQNSTAEKGRIYKNLKNGLETLYFSASCSQFLLSPFLMDLCYFIASAQFELYAKAV